MICTDSREFFELSMGPQTDNSLKSRFECLKDFVKKCFGLPISLIIKGIRTVLRVLGAALSLALLFLTLGGARSVREMFIERIVILAKDLADWVLLPLAWIFCFVRLVLALLIHPNFYFNAL